MGVSDTRRHRRGLRALVIEAKRERQSGDSSRSTSDSWRTHEWRPTKAVSIMWTILGALLTMLGVIIFGLFYIVLVPTEPPDTFTFNAIYLVLIAAGVLAVHEGFHGLAAVYYGGRPTFGATMLHKFVPVLYCTVEGHMFTRGQFSAFALAPLVGISALGMLAMIVTPWGLWIIFLLAMNFGGSIGDISMTWLVARQPAGTMVEDMKDGVRFHYPQPA